MTDLSLDHDPTSCTRRPCGKCRPPGPRSTPPVVDHQSAKHTPQPPRLAGLTPQQTHAMLIDLATRVDRHGPVTWQHVVDWRKHHRLTMDSTRGGGNGGTNDDERREHKADEQVGRLYDRLEAALNDLATAAGKVSALITETIPTEIQRVKLDRLAAQVAADGWCRSCFRDDQHLEPITLRPGDKQEPYYRDLCRFCGEWQAEHGQLPAVDVLNLRHTGRRIRRSA